MGIKNGLSTQLHTKNKLDWLISNTIQSAEIELFIAITATNHAHRNQEYLPTGTLFPV